MDQCEMDVSPNRILRCCLKLKSRLGNHLASALRAYELKATFYIRSVDVSLGATHSVLQSDFSSSISSISSSFSS
jgi:hypothetical protein